MVSLWLVGPARFSHSVNVTTTTLHAIFQGADWVEIVFGKRNRGFNNSKHGHNLGLAWSCYLEGAGLEVLDPLIAKSCIAPQVLRMLLMWFCPKFTVKLKAQRTHLPMSKACNVLKLICA
ncbi:hypothetical protein Drorol1_Dr00000066 [Drosera rotundifolia]